MKYMKEGLQHYDIGDHRPHGPRGNPGGNVGGRFIARERGAFQSSSVSKQDVPYVILNAVIQGAPLATRGRGMVHRTLAGIEFKKAANIDFDTAVRNILQDTK
jgi:hypothetical protein